MAGSTFHVVWVAWRKDCQTKTSSSSSAKRPLVQASHPKAQTSTFASLQSTIAIVPLELLVWICKPELALITFVGQIGGFLIVLRVFLSCPAADCAVSATLHFGSRWLREAMLERPQLPTSSFGSKTDAAACTLWLWWLHLGQIVLCSVLTTKSTAFLGENSIEIYGCGQPSECWFWCS